MSDVLSTLFLDRNDKKIINYHEQDVEPILEHNAMLRSQPQKSDWGRHIASVPNVIWMKWINDSGVEWWKMGSAERRAWEDKLMEEKLRNPDNAKFRVDK